MSKVLNEIDQAVTITGKAAGIVLALVTFAAAMVPPAELNEICDRLWSAVKSRYFTEEK